MYCLEFASEEQAQKALEPHGLYLAEAVAFNPCFVVTVPPSRVPTGEKIAVIDDSGETVMVDETVAKDHFLLNIAGALPDDLAQYCVVPASPRVVFAGDAGVQDPADAKGILHGRVSRCRSGRLHGILPLHIT